MRGYCCIYSAPLVLERSSLSLINLTGNERKTTLMSENLAEFDYIVVGAGSAVL